jgi:pimeloyl-ACP methyl ester carboxylesterase
MQEIEYCEIEGLRTRWAHEGDGTPVVLVHGGGGGYALGVWKDVAAGLATKGWRVVTVDLPGHGETAMADGQVPSIPLFLEHFLEDVCKMPVHLVGHSHNGAHVMTLALSKPALLRSAVSVGTGRMLPGYDLEARTAVRERLPRPAVAFPTLASVRDILRRDVYSDDSLTDDRVEEVFRWAVARAERQATRSATENLTSVPNADEDEMPLWSRIGRAEVPVLAVFGAQDKNRAGELGSRLAFACPNVRVEMVERCAHLVQWDAPEVLVGHLDDFFSAVDR